MSIIWEEYELSPNLGIVCIDFCLFIGSVECEELTEDYLILTQYIGFGMDHQYFRCTESKEIQLGAYNDPELEQLGRNIEDSSGKSKPLNIMF